MDSITIVSFPYYLQASASVSLETVNTVVENSLDNERFVQANSQTILSDKMSGWGIGPDHELNVDLHEKSLNTSNWASFLLERVVFWHPARLRQP